MAKVLIIEDDPYVLRLYRRLFTIAKFELETATSGGIGLELVGSFQPHVVLLDIMMPGMNGIEVLEHLKASTETKDIPVIMLTNLDSDETVNKAFELGAEAFLVKSDFSPEQVLNVVSETIERKK
jgi:DNA-binding response OmpR family regulator